MHNEWRSRNTVITQVGDRNNWFGNYVVLSVKIKAHSNGKELLHYKYTVCHYRYISLTIIITCFTSHAVFPLIQQANPM